MGKMGLDVDATFCLAWDRVVARTSEGSWSIVLIRFITWDFPLSFGPLEEEGGDSWASLPFESPEVGL